MAPAKPIVEKKRRYFTVEEANKALPLVRMIVGDIVRQYRVVEDLQQRLAMVAKERRRPSTDLYSEELAQSQAELDAEEGKLRSYIEELRRLGVEFKGADGLCDFYSIMDGREVFKYAVTKLPQTARALLEETGINIEQIDWFLAHQANKRINEYIREHLGVPEAKMPMNIDRYGNTSAATIPILVDELTRAGKLKRGELNMMLALGAGIHWGCALVRW